MLVLQSFSTYCAHYFLVCKSFLQIVFLSNSHVHCICDIVMSLSQAPSQMVWREAISNVRFLTGSQAENNTSHWDNCSDGSLLFALFLFFIPLTPLKFCLTSFRLQVSNKLQPYFMRGSVLHISVDSIFTNHITIPLWAILFRHLELYMKSL